MRLAGRVAVVTGAGGGIGGATAIRLGQEGAKVVVNDIREAEANATVQRIQANGGEAIAVVADVVQRAGAERLIETAVGRYGSADILCNIAGGARGGRLVELTEEIWDGVLALNLRPNFLCSKFAIPHMQQRGWGRIVSVSSIAYQGAGGQVPYAAAKAGVVGFTKSLALEVAQAGITVNCVVPGFILTPPALRLPEATRAEMIAKVPLGRGADPAEVAACIAFLVSDDASYVTGEELWITGGRQWSGGNSALIGQNRALPKLD